MLGNGSRPESFLDAVLFVRPMTNPDAGRPFARDASLTDAGLNSGASRFHGDVAPERRSNGRQKVLWELVNRTSAPSVIAWGDDGPHGRRHDL